MRQFILFTPLFLIFIYQDAGICVEEGHRSLRVPIVSGDTTVKEREDRWGESWQTALSNSKNPPKHLITEFRYKVNGYPDIYDIATGLEKLGVSVTEWEIPIPKNLTEIVKEFVNKNPWANGHGYSMEELERIVSTLPSYLKVFAIHFQGTANPSDPALVVVGGSHPNEKASIPSAVWFINRMLEGSIGDLIFLKKYFSHIFVVVPHSPIGYALGLRIGWNGDMTRFVEPFSSEKTRDLLADRIKEPEMREYYSKKPIKESPEHARCGEYLKKELGLKFPYRKGLFVIEFHDFNLPTEDRKAVYFPNESLLVIDGDISNIASKYIGGIWGRALEEAGFNLASAEGVTLRKKIIKGVAVSNILNSDINPGLDFHSSFTVEGGSNALGKRMQEHHISLVSIAQSIIELYQEKRLDPLLYRLQRLPVRVGL